MSKKITDSSLLRTKIIRLRVTETEAELFKFKAKKGNFKNVSEYIRFCCIDEDTNNKNEDHHIESE